MTVIHRPKHIYQKEVDDEGNIFYDKIPNHDLKVHPRQVHICKKFKTNVGYKYWHELPYLVFFKKKVVASKTWEMNVFLYRHLLSDGTTLILDYGIHPE